jgi:hypothetical protein
MYDLERRHPITSGILEGAVVGTIAGLTSPFTPIATGFLAAAAMVLGAYMYGSRSRPKCPQSQNKSANPSPQ